jgi:hypothetical protein
MGERPQANETDEGALGWACSSERKIKNGILLSKSLDKHPFRRPRMRQEDNIKMDLRK